MLGAGTQFSFSDHHSCLLGSILAGNKNWDGGRFLIPGTLIWHVSVCLNYWVKCLSPSYLFSWKSSQQTRLLWFCCCCCYCFSPSIFVLAWREIKVQGLDRNVLKCFWVKVVWSLKSELWIDRFEVLWQWLLRMKATTYEHLVVSGSKRLSGKWQSWGLNPELLITEPV